VYNFSPKGAEEFKNKRPQTPPEVRETLMSLGDKLVPILYSDNFHLHFAAAWAFAWLGEADSCSQSCIPSVLARLVDIWKGSSLYEVQRVSTWAISSLPIMDRELKPLGQPDSDLIKFIKAASSSPEKTRNYEFYVPASLIVAFYYKSPWTDAEIANEAVKVQSYRSFRMHSLLEALGEVGKVELERLKEEKRALRKKIKGKSAK
jgi:hypothetical protein